MQKTLRLVTILAWGLYIPAYAQTPTFSPPPLPAPPSFEDVIATPVVADDEAQKNADKEAAIKDGLKQIESAANTGGISNPNLSAPSGPIPYMVKPPSMTLDNPAPEPENVTAPPPVFALPTPPAALNLQATRIPEVKVEAAKEVPTWKETLKPSYKPMRTSFNFRRQVMPSTIYRDSYSLANRHLPAARNGVQYDHYFILAAARNDLNAVRAMLDSGHRDANLVNAEGDSVLIVAIRHNAIAAARLLLARGANPTQPGQNGMTAMDYARHLNNEELMAAIRERLS